MNDYPKLSVTISVTKYLPKFPKMALSREKALIIAAKHVETVSNSSVEEELVVLSPLEKVNVVFSPDVAVAFGKKSQDATNLKAVKFDFESPQCFSIGKLPEVNKPPPLTPYGHGVARNVEVMKKFLENAKKDVASTFCFSITKGPCRMLVDLDTKVCDDVTKVEDFGHRYIQVSLTDFILFFFLFERQKIFTKLDN